MDYRIAIWFFVGLAALLTAGILYFLLQATRVLARLEETTRKLEENAVPLLQSLRRITDEIEPIVHRTSERYQTLEEGLDNLSRSPVFSLLSPVLRLGVGPFKTLGGIVRVLRGAFAGFSKAREVLKTPQSIPVTEKKMTLTSKEQETTHGQ
jgi:hypothetical protein